MRLQEEAHFYHNYYWRRQGTSTLLVICAFSTSEISMPSGHSKFQGIITFNKNMNDYDMITDQSFRNSSLRHSHSSTKPMQPLYIVLFESTCAALVSKSSYIKIPVQLLHSSEMTSIRLIGVHVIFCSPRQQSHTAVDENM
jgi:hypothetical protein